MYTNRFSNITESVIDRFLEKREEIKNYVLESLSNGASIEEIYDSLEESIPMSRREALRWLAGMAGVGGGLLGGAITSPAKFHKSGKKQSMAQGGKDKKVGMMPGVPPTDVGSAGEPVRKSGRTPFTDV